MAKLSLSKFDSFDNPYSSIFKTCPLLSLTFEGTKGVLFISRLLLRNRVIVSMAVFFKYFNPIRNRR